MDKANRILTQDEIYQLLLTALKEKEPIPPENWSFVKFEGEVHQSTKEYEPNAFVRQNEALKHSLYCLVRFARQMPERVNLSESNQRVGEMCRDLASEIERITNRPDEVISERGKLLIWLKAILAVQPCWVYREETERVLAEREQAKKNQRQNSVRSKPLGQNLKSFKPPKMTLAKTILQKILPKKESRESKQPSLF